MLASICFFAICIIIVYKNESKIFISNLFMLNSSKNENPFVSIMTLSYWGLRPKIFRGF